VYSRITAPIPLTGIGKGGECSRRIISKMTIAAVYWLIIAEDLLMLLLLLFLYALSCVLKYSSSNRYFIFLVFLSDILLMWS